ncbi:DUF2490 domain-containing protein [Aquimarina algicola]|uniref:DUF2490 domain-containing protein n=2 Tax=Aquimarina algicola TaxID=2589995 RepID=A0A504JE30_9FLAO|nr:DUF2490 domain-containing protein [Aquimarina algicola]
MCNRYIRFICIGIMYFYLIHTATSQTEFSSGLLPEITFSTKISDRFKLIHAVESRQIITDNTKENSFNYDYILTDFTTLLSTKVGASGVLNLGYLFRVEEDQIIHRSIQQYNIVQLLRRGRIGHRVATDQTFTNNEAPEFRLRYRITLEKPLTGDEIDPKEFYIKLGNEYLTSFQQDETDLEIRILPFLGYEINKKSKIEIGPDYRISGFSESGSSHKLWLSIGWFYAFDTRNKEQHTK